MRYLTKLEQNIITKIFQIKGSNLLYSNKLPALLTSNHSDYNPELQLSAYLPIERLPAVIKNKFSEHSWTELERDLRFLFFQQTLSIKSFDEQFGEELRNIFFHNEYLHYKPLYAQFDFLSNEAVDRKAKTQCILILIFRYYRDNNRLNFIFNYLANECSLDLEIPLSTPLAFRKFLCRKEQIGFPRALIHGHFGKPSNNREISQFMKHVLILLSINVPTHRTASAIKADLDNMISQYPSLKNVGIDSLSQSRISKFLKTSEAKSIISYAKDDPLDFKRTVTGILHFLPASAPLVKVYIDGYLFQIHYLDEVKQTADELVGVFIQDDRSEAILGLSIGESENFENVNRAFQNFLRSTAGEIPIEMVMDKFTYKIVKSMPRLMEIFMRHGVVLTASSNPNRKAPLERFFLLFQQLVMSHSLIQYIGPGIKSRQKNAHPFKAFKVMLRQRKNLLDFFTLSSTLKYLINNTYNQNTTLKDLVVSPWTIFKSEAKVSRVKLPDYMIPYMLFEHHQLTVKAASICITNKQDVFFYYRRDFEFITKFNGQVIDVFVDPCDRTKIFIFELSSVHFLGTLDLYELIPSADFDRLEKHRDYVANFSKVTQDLLTQFEHEIKTMTKNVRKQIGNKEMDELTIRALRKKEMDSNDIRIRMGLSESVQPPVMFHANKSRRKGRRGDEIDDLGFELTSTF